MGTASIKKNFIFNLFSQFVTFAVPFITNPYVSRIFGATGIGISSYTAANVTYFTLFGMLGISGYGQREIAICRDNRRETSAIFCELQFIHFVSFLFTGAVYLLLVINSSENRMYYVVHALSLLASLLDINWFYQAYERFQFIAIRNCVVKLISLACIFAFIHDSGDLVLYILITVMGVFLSNLTLWAGIKRYVDIVPLKELRLKRHLKDVFIFFIPTIAASVYSILDKSVINWITHDNAENGYYEQAYKIVTIANIFIQTLSHVAAPRMSNIYSKGDMQGVKNRLNNALQFMLLISLPVAFGIAGIAKRFVPLFFGVGFDKVIIILYVFMPMVVVLGFSVYLDGMYLVPSGKRGQSAMAVCIGSALNLFLNMGLVYLLQSVGAAVATLLTECVVSGIMIYLSREVMDFGRVFKGILRYGIISAAMGAAVCIIGKFIVNDLLCLAVQLCMGIVIYATALLTIKDGFVHGFLKRSIEKFQKQKAH